VHDITTDVEARCAHHLLLEEIKIFLYTYHLIKTH
jgi:hypothetical protein